jgi:hypothetical protein
MYYKTLILSRNGNVKKETTSGLVVYRKGFRKRRVAMVADERRKTLPRRSSNASIAPEDNYIRRNMPPVPESN